MSRIGIAALLLSALGCSKAEPVLAESAPDAVEARAVTGVRNVHAVGSLYLAGQPDGDGLAALADEGVTVVINLRPPRSWATSTRSRPPASSG